MIPVAILPPGTSEPFPPADRALHEPNGLLAIGADLQPSRLLDAYRHGIFPWFSEGEPILWWSPDPRMIFATDHVHVSARLRRWLKSCEWEIHADSAFEAVMRACAEPRPGQRGTWITDAMLEAYLRLHALGHAHSVEVHDAGKLIGGIYGVAVGRMFFGESMFSRASNASKLALIALARALRDWDMPLLDAQIPSAHLRSLGAYEIPRDEFIAHVIKFCDAKPFIEGSWQSHWSIRNAGQCL